MEYHRQDLVDQGIEAFDGLDARAQESFLLINLQRNQLTNFEHFGTHPYLSELHLQHNNIESFRGLTKQAALRMLCLQGCPIAAHPYYRLMALLTVGLGIEVIDGLPVTSQERHIAKSLGQRAALAVSYGWLLDLRPRTLEDYDALISDHKRLRRDERRQLQGRQRTTVDSVLAELSRGQPSRSATAATAQQLEERERTITRLARRVAQLEGQLAATAEGHVIPMLPPNQLEVLAADGDRLSTPGGVFSAAEMAQVDAVSFTRGIQLRHNLALNSGGLAQICLQLDHAALTAQTFLTRDTIVQLSLRGLRVRHLRPLTLVVEDEMGGALGLVFDALPLLHTVYKAIFVLSSRPIPPLSGVTQRQLQELARATEKLPKAAPPAAITFPAASSGGGSVAAASAFEAETADADADEAPLQSVVFEQASTAGAADSVVFQTEGDASQRPAVSEVGASPGSAHLDNVEDVPPLPAAFSRMGTDSIVFSVDKSRPAASAAADDSAQASINFKSSSNIDFQSAGPSNKTSVEANVAAAAPAEVSKPTEAAKPPSNQKNKLFANLLVNSSTSSDSVVFHSDDAKSDGEDSVVLEEVAKATPPAAVPPSKVPLAPRPGLAVPPRPPPRKSQVATPAVSVPASATRRSAVGTPTTGAAASPLPPRGPPSTRSLEKSSVNSSAVRGSKSHLSGAAGENSITFRMDDVEAEGKPEEGGEARNDATGSKANAPANVSPPVPATAAVAPTSVPPPPPRVPSRFGALRVDSDSD